MNVGPTRRAALSLFSAAVAGFGQKKASSSNQLSQVGEFVRYADAITETPVVRLTNLSSASFLPARENRAVSVKGRFLVFSSDRGGMLSPFRLDLRTGQVTQLFSSRSLDPRSLSLDAAFRTLLFLDGGSLKQLPLGNKRVQVLAENVSRFSVGASREELLVVRDGKLCGVDGKVLADGAAWCQMRPSGGSCLFSRRVADAAEELWYLPLRTSGKPVLLAAAPISEPCWAPDGHSALFLRDQSICEVVPEGGSEQRLGGTSHFASFSANADTSVFAGAARSKAQPTINLLLRTPPREFTLCEHKASRPELCEPVFSADSRRVYFNSDFQGKPAIYSVNVEGLIEETSQ